MNLWQKLLKNKVCGDGLADCLAIFARGGAIWEKFVKQLVQQRVWGARFLLATKALAKEMLPTVDKPTIQFVVEEAKASGIENILIIEGKSKCSIEDHFDSAPELEQDLAAKKMAMLTSHLW